MTTELPTKEENNVDKQHPAFEGIRSTITGLVINVCLAVIKISAGIIGNSFALVADGIESATDVFSSSIVFLGLHIAAKPADENHPYGHGKAEPLAAVAVSLGLFGAAFSIAVNSINELRLPHKTPAAFTLIILVIVVIIKEILFRHVNRVGEDIDSNAVKSDAWHHRSDAITSSAAFIGILIALIGGKGYAYADDWAALFASFIIGLNALLLFRPALLELTDVAPDSGIREQVMELALGAPGVVGLDKCFVRKVGLDYYVDLEILVDEWRTVREGHDIAHDAQEIIRKALPKVAKVLIHVEPGEEAKT